MNVVTEQALLMILEKANLVGDFVLSEAPDVIHQLLLWKMISAIGVGVFCLCIMTSFGLVLYKARVANWCRSDLGVAAILLGIFSLFATVFAIEAFGRALQIWLAPKIFLIEYAASFIR